MRISIIIPVYNKEMYLEECLNSIIKQTFSDFECILIDDGSDDSSGSICDRYHLKDNRIKPIHIKNNGVSHARNVGIEHAEGDYITFVDSDDILAIDYLESLISAIQESKADIVIQSLYVFKENVNNGHTIEYPLETGIYELKKLMPYFAEYQSTCGMFGWCCGKILTKKLIDDIRFNEKYTLAEDFDFYLHIYSRIKTVYIDKKAHYYYRAQAINSSVMIDDYKINYENQLLINIEYKAFLKQMGFFSGRNKEILDKSILNYIFFSIFYCDINHFNEVFDRVYVIYTNEELPQIKEPLFKKFILLLIKHNNMNAAKLTIVSYRFLRKIIKKNTTK